MSNINTVLTLEIDSFFLSVVLVAVFSSHNTYWKIVFVDRSSTDAIKVYTCGKQYI